MNLVSSYCYYKTCLTKYLDVHTKLFLTLIQEKFIGKKIMGKVFTIREQSSAFGSVGCESHILHSPLGTL